MAPRKNKKEDKKDKKVADEKKAMKIVKAFKLKSSERRVHRLQSHGSTMSKATGTSLVCFLLVYPSNESVQVMHVLSHCLDRAL